MGVIEKERAREMVTMWVEAEKAVMAGQSYTITVGGMSRSVTKANLKEIRDSINYWTKKYNRLSGTTSGLKIHYPKV